MNELWLMRHTSLGRFTQIRELVQCKDCKRCQHDILFTQYWCDGRRVDPEGFCEKGEKKDG